MFMLMISAYSVFAKDYTTYHRLKLKSLFDGLEVESKAVQNSI